jgi:hypothetical protein|tara:strand:+ start:2793 stop:3131 length:339 start_codon:yes stop_codon:yes gene_type:complete
MAKQIELSEVVIREQISSRGGGVEIDLSRFGFKGQKMSAYQNYLGGSMLGSIQTNDTIRRESFRGDQTDKVNTKLDKIALRLSKYFHSLTNPEDEWEGMEFEQRQTMPSSAY